MDDPILRLLREAVEGCQAAEATYWEVSEDGVALRARVNSGPASASLEGLQVPVEGSLVGMVFCTGMATAMGPDAGYHPAAASVSGIPTEAMAAAIVRVRGRAAGVLSTINPEGRALFHAKDLDLVQWKAFLLGCLLEHLDHGA